MTFVPDYQFLELVDEINEEFPEADIRINNSLRYQGVIIDFDGLDDHFRPHWLGHSTNRDLFNFWVGTMPFPTSDLTTSDIEDAKGFPAFRAKMEMVIEAGKKPKSKKSGKKAKKPAPDPPPRPETRNQIRRARQYLGFASRTTNQKTLPNIGGLSISASSIDPNQPAPFPFAHDAIIIAIDCEAWEQLPHQVTEVGIATLDTRDIKGEAPGSIGEVSAIPE